MPKCILCKEEPATGATTTLYCKRCAGKDVLAKMAALQRDTRFKDAATEYQDECWGKEIVLKSDSELSKQLQKKCVSFSPVHIGFKEMVEEVKNFNKSIPQLIRAKIDLRKRTKIELQEIKGIIKSLKEEIEKTKEIKGKKGKTKLKDFRDDLKEFEKKKKTTEEELKKLEKKK